MECLSAQQLSRVETALEILLDLPEGERDAALDRSCDNDPQVRDEVASLLGAAARVGGFLETPAQPAVDPPAGAAEVPATDAKLGAWRLLRRIGCGGMGEVFEAERVDGSYRQHVAVKLLRAEAALQLDRFYAERQILARLNHPGIAQLHDGGVAADGRPYMVMEYVAGRSITDYCAQTQASLEQRLGLFAQVCSAVAYAHRNLVVHRDLKPANILVTAEGQVKLLDFGIAKLLQDGEEAATTTTVLAPLTPAYAAPEQLAGAAITTATDVYALGVLLFELLTAVRPWPEAGAPVARVLRAILEQPAPAPSAAAARADAPVAARLLRGDLDAVVARCLRKEPAHRYATVDALRLDLQRHQDAEPVLAREGARLYRLGRFVRRYRWAVAGAALLIGGLSAALSVSLWQARRAEREARTSAAVQNFLGDLFRANSSRQADPVRARQTTALELLNLGAAKIDGALADVPEAKSGVVALLASLYDDLALDDAAVKLRKQAVALARQLNGEDSEELAVALTALAESLHASSTVNERGAVLDQAAAILDRRGDKTSATRGRLLLNLTEHFQSSDQLRALAYANEAVAVFGARARSGGLAEAFYARGLIEEDRRALNAAVADFGRAIEVSRAADGVPNPALPRFYAYLGQVQYNLQDFAQAESSARQALAMARAVNGDEHVDTLQTQMRLGRILFDGGRTTEGLALLAAARQLALKIRGADDPFHTPQTQLELGYAQGRFGLLEDGLANVDLAIANRRRNRPGTQYLETMLEDAATLLIDLGRLAEARADLDEGSAIAEKIGLALASRKHNTRERIRLALAQGDTAGARVLIERFGAAADADAAPHFSIEGSDGRLLAAEADLAEGRSAAAIERTRSVRAAIAASGQADFLSGYAMRADALEGQALLRSGDAGAALPLLERALQQHRQLLAPSSPKLAAAAVMLADCKLTLGDRKAARALADEAKTIEAAHPTLGEQNLRPLRELQARLYASR